MTSSKLPTTCIYFKSLDTLWHAQLTQAVWGADTLPLPFRPAPNLKLEQLLTRWSLSLNILQPRSDIPEKTVFFTSQSFSKSELATAGEKVAQSSLHFSQPTLRAPCLLLVCSPARCSQRDIHVVGCSAPPNTGTSRRVMAPADREVTLQVTWPGPRSSLDRGFPCSGKERWRSTFAQPIEHQGDFPASSCLQMMRVLSPIRA